MRWRVRERITPFENDKYGVVKFEMLQVNCNKKSLHQINLIDMKCMDGGTKELLKHQDGKSALCAARKHKMYTGKNDSNTSPLKFVITRHSFMTYHY